MSKRRRRLTRADKQRISLEQGGLCGCGCGKPLGDKVIGEHTTPFALSGTPKPDALYNVWCAKKKTFGGPGRVGGDIRDIFHAKRLRDGKTQHDKRKKRGFGSIISQGFSKLFKKKMSGKVERRK